MKYSNLCKEEKTLLSVIFENISISEKNPENLDFGKLIKILSKNLIIPLFYVKARDKNLLKNFEKEFVDYIKEIYEINKNRNEKLLNELSQIKSLLENNNIAFKFLKGAGLLENKFYSDIGERMIGDIDILVSPSEEDNILGLLKTNNYYIEIKNYNRKKDRHLPRAINKNKLFAIEFHYRVLRDDGILDDEEILYSTKPEILLKNLLLINVYNWQINDYGSIFLNYSYKNIYDSFLIIEKFQNFEYLIKNKILVSYFKNINNLGILDLPKGLINKFWALNFLFYLKSNFNLVFKIIIVFKIFVLKLNEIFRVLYSFLTSSNYRQFLKKKYFIKF